MKYPGIERLTELLSGTDEPGEHARRPLAGKTYDETTRQMVLDVVDDVRSLRRRLDALIFMVLSAILVEAATRFFGG